ncbi:MAG TPA: gamma-glutamyltransferase family protein [Bryobacteraceae bacterium]|jgi:gamma-glutamyltranspeptidase/glutathione hydrolase|nr:gamma-glutamyltransferase family protein [Bryobacteraceae bacterium]
MGRLFLLIACTALSLTLTAAGEEPAARPYWRTLVRGTHGMVAAEHPLQAMAGLKALEAGGNAIDAALSVYYMTSVVEQHQSGLGSDCYVLAYIAKEKKVVFFNGTGPAPKLATLETYRKLGGIPVNGPYSVSVPGAVSGFDLAWKKYGSKDYASLLKPAIEAASNGHVLTEWAATNYVEVFSLLKKYPSSARTLLPAGTPPSAGDLFRQADLGRTLETIVRDGADVFYRGRLARMTAETYEKAGGVLRYEDLAGFRAEQAEPIHTPYKGYEVYESAPNSQGIVLLIALNILEGLDLKSLGYNSPGYVHVITEALKLAFADRDQYIADPRVIKDIPVAGLLAKAYAAERRKLIRMDRAIQGMAPPGDPRGVRGILGGRRITYEGSNQPVRPATSGSGSGGQGETSSFSIADSFGNLVSVTHSVNGTFGSGLVVEGGGFVLNNRLPCFYLEDGNVNILAPGKRTRHTICPALAMKDGKPFLAWNTPGGDNQPQAMLQAFLNVVEFGMNAQQAVEGPTVMSKSFHESVYPHPVAGTLVVPKVLADRIGSALSALGHRVVVTPLQGPYNQQPSGAGAVKMALIDPRSGVFSGAASPAKDDYVMGW